MKLPGALHIGLKFKRHVVIIRDIAIRQTRLIKNDLDIKFRNIEHIPLVDDDNFKTHYRVRDAFKKYDTELQIMNALWIHMIHMIKELDKAMGLLRNPLIYGRGGSDYSKEVFSDPAYKRLDELVQRVDHEIPHLRAVDLMQSKKFYEGLGHIIRYCDKLLEQIDLLIKNRLNKFQDI